jgi:hypothetical protein
MAAKEKKRAKMEKDIERRKEASARMKERQKKERESEKRLLEYYDRQKELEEQQRRMEQEKSAEDKELEALRKEREKVEIETMKLAKKIVKGKEKERAAADKIKRKEERAKEKLEEQMRKDSIKFAEEDALDLERYAEEDADDASLELTSKQRKLLKKIQENRKKKEEEARQDSMLLINGDFDMMTGERDNSDLTPEQREKFDVKEEPVAEEEFVMEEEDMAFEINDSTGLEMIPDDLYSETDSTEGEVEEVKSMIDSTLLQQQIAELEMELQNIRDIKELQEQKGRKGETILLKIKIPNCRYLNDVYYVRDKFEFRYEYNFFLHYFDHRYFHRKRFYDRVDSTRIVAKHVMKLVGNSKYRHTDFNKIADSVGTILPNYPVVEYLDSVITQLNLEYLATGEIKIKYRNTRQKSIYSKLKPSKIKQEGSLGDIKFYTGNRRRIIEELDASQFDSLVIADEGDKVKLHIHTREPERILAYCHEYGEFLSLKIENMSVQHHELPRTAQVAKENRCEYFSVVAVAHDPSMGRHFEEMGADAVMIGDRREPPSAAEFCEAFRRTGASHLLVFPNGKNAQLAAHQVYLPSGACFSD